VVYWPVRSHEIRRVSSARNYTLHRTLKRDLPTNSPNLPLFSPMKHTPIDSSRSAVGNRNFLASSRTSVDFVKLARGTLMDMNVLFEERKDEKFWGV
jgi:hypothetical protein